MFDAIVEDFISSFYQESKPKTQHDHRTRVGYLVAYLTQASLSDVQRLSHDVVLSFQDFIKSNKQFSSNTQYVILHDVKRFLGFLYQKHYVWTDYSDVIVLPKWERKKPRVYTESEKLEILSKTTDLRDKALVSLFLYESLNTAQLHNLSTHDIDIHSQTIRLKAECSFRALSLTSERYLKMYLKARQTQAPLSDGVFLTTVGYRKMTRQSIRIVIRKAVKRCGM